MEQDNTLKLSYLLSAGIHASVFLLFTFVIVLDFGSIVRPLEVIYIGHAGLDADQTDDVPEEAQSEAPPPVDLPDRVFATESVVSNSGQEVSPVPTLAGKLDLSDSQSKGMPEETVAEALKPEIASEKILGLAANERYVIEGDLSERKIILRPPIPEYPDWAVRRGVDANVTLRVTVSPEGVVERVESLESTGYRRMDLVASKYIKQWRFESRAFDTESETGIISVKFRLK